MEMYRIISAVKSPFVFSKEDAKFRCKQANEHFKNINHISILELNYTKEEIRYMYPENISFSKLEAIVKGLKNNEMPIL